eukprot:CAMPEP_0175132462 /NCGR_PEP_ID=MMETSP0087-20121206/7087_1 /TAXON_ID=136419 /ORGANISM="Unknown Unknown, Strain D1" /LENGTH=105 /DNA_ID=CAMNT_0016414817 /DNA_START=81 /DNA_END=396 /DNA_ORIENTATION=+
MSLKTPNGDEGRLDRTSQSSLLLLLMLRKATVGVDEEGAVSPRPCLSSVIPGGATHLYQARAVLGRSGTGIQDVARLEVHNVSGPVVIAPFQMSTATAAAAAAAA